MSAFGTFEATVAVLRGLCAEAASPPRVLDAGCGDGRHLHAVAPMIAAGLGIDPSRAAIAAAEERAREAPHLAFRVTQLEALQDDPPAPFDLVTFIGSLEHMADPRVALLAASRLLRPGGRILVVAIAPFAPHAVLSRIALSRSAMPVVAHLGAAGVRRLGETLGLALERECPLYRGTRASRAGRAAQPLLALYDRAGGATTAVVFKRPA